MHAFCRCKFQNFSLFRGSHANLLLCELCVLCGFLINAGRGPLQIDDDILAALDDGTLEGVTLDVFPQEPLPPESPMWGHPKVTVTPHNAGDILPDLLAAQVMRQIERLERGEPLDNLVDRRRGY